MKDEKEGGAPVGAPLSFHPSSFKLQPYSPMSLRIIRLLLPVELDARGDAVVLAGEDVILPQGEALPVVGAEDAAQVGVAVEDDAEQVVRLALVPVGGRPEADDARHVRLGARAVDLDRDSVPEVVRPE